MAILRDDPIIVAREGVGSDQGRSRRGYPARGVKVGVF